MFPLAGVASWCGTAIASGSSSRGLTSRTRGGCLLARDRLALWRRKYGKTRPEPRHAGLQGGEATPAARARASGIQHQFGPTDIVAQDERPLVGIARCWQLLSATSLGIVESLERLVVHVEEAVRLAIINDDPHLRLGLLLLDSAAELLLHRECQSRFQWAERDRQLMHLAEETRAATGKEPEWLAELRESALSLAQWKKIDRDFGAKCDYLAGRGMLTEPHERVLKKLHKYRNEAYHRDQLRLGTLASATKIYIYLVCSLMLDFPMHGTGGFIHLSPRPPAGLVKYLEEDENWVSLLLDTGESIGLQARIASRLLTEAGIAPPFGLGEVLSQHFCGRLDAVREAAGEAASFFYWPGRDEGWDWEAVLCLAQLDPWNLPRVMSSDEVKSAAVAFRPAQINQWRAEGEALASQADDLAAFAAFADLEDAFEPLEELVDRLATDVDRELQLQYDIARGK
jgi:hypothetical protein